MRGHQGNAASLSAWDKHQTRNSNSCQMVYEVIFCSKDGMTSKEVAQVLGWPINQVSGRFSDLEKRMGKIIGIGIRRMGAEVHVVVREMEQMNLMECA